MRLHTRSSLVQSSLLDRLMDDEPNSAVEAQPETHYDINRYKRSVARDLESLLNTRSVLLGETPLDEFPHVRNSLLTFGITDLSSLSLLDPDDRIYLKDSIRATIEQHEPRLTRVRVTLDIAKEYSRILRFRVDALLKVHPSRPPVSFDAMLHLSSNTYQVNG